MNQQIKSSYILLGVAIVVVAVFFFRGCRVEKYRDSKVRGGEFRRPQDIVAIHSSHLRWLTVGDQTYRGVRGMPPYYLDVPGTDAVFFVTENGGKVAFHVVNAKRGEAIEIEGKGSTFGWNIGSKRTQGEQFTDWVESATNGQIVLGMRTDWGKVLTLLDLSKKAVLHEEALYLDATGHATNRVVFPKTN